jgi:hypothetical protein
MYKAQLARFWTKEKKTYVLVKLLSRFPKLSDTQSMFIMHRCSSSMFRSHGHQMLERLRQAWLIPYVRKECYSPGGALVGACARLYDAFASACGCGCARIAASRAGA